MTRISRWNSWRVRPPLDHGTHRYRSPEMRSAAPRSDPALVSGDPAPAGMLRARPLKDVRDGARTMSVPEIPEWGVFDLIRSRLIRRIGLQSNFPLNHANSVLRLAPTRSADDNERCRPAQSPCQEGCSEWVKGEARQPSSFQRRAPLQR